MNTKVSALWGAALAALLAAPAGFAQTSRIIDSIVAVVEEDVVLRSELDRSIATVLKQFANTGQQLPSRGILERQILEQLALMKIKLQNATATGIRINDSEIDTAIQRVARQSGITLDQMRRTIVADGLSWEQFREDMRNELSIQQLERRVANSRVNVSESEIDIFLSNQDQPQGEYRLGHILIIVPEGASPEEVQASRAKADEVHQELLDGMDFATAAITYSNGPQALQGGDLGWRPAAQVPTVIEAELSELSKGEFTRPIRDASGYHLFKVTDYRATSQTMITEINCRHIMVAINEVVGPDEALDIITNIHERLLSGEDFGELAKQFSDDTSSANLGGDMGWFQPGTFGGRVREVIDSLADGELSQPFQSAGGWHLIQKIATREQDRTEEIQREQAREAIRLRKAEEELRLWQRQIRDEAYVEFRI